MLNNKKILVAGAAGLLGSSLVCRLLDEGAQVVAVDLEEARLLDRLSASGYSTNPGLTVCAMDIGRKADVVDFFSNTRGLDGAVNCAYPRNKQYGRGFFEVELEDFNDNVSMHLGSSFLFIQECARYFKRSQREFSLVNISSVYGVIPPKFEVYEGTPMTMPVEYAAIKSALIHLSKYVTTFVSDSRFRSNCVSPGGIRDKQPEAFLSRYKSSCLGKGMLDIEDVLGTIVFLLSEQSRYVNGQNIVVDDGFTL
ncbi:oxidoreductase [Pseudomonas sp. BJa3]|uniref:oxidoreductase n=1 Tax=Pseudomonas sp. BJa3 TaxID=2986525 RepID=UPI002265876B|nr:oxidoreductase [Pseudomonas sp. BJa3]MCX5509233.1 oxidoreductase [Pseudomonas sp. BJa3]